MVKQGQISTVSWICPQKDHFEKNLAALMTMEVNVILELCDIFCTDSNCRNSRKLLSKPFLCKTSKEATYLVLHVLPSSLTDFLLLGLNTCSDISTCIPL